MAQTSDWGAALAAEVGKRISRYRALAGYTAERLAQSVTDAGAPMTRSVLANLESGRRPTVSLAELVTFSHVLGVPLVALIVDYGREDQVELLPDAPPMSMEHAVSWLRDGPSETHPSKAFEAWLAATSLTQDYSTWITENPAATNDERERVRAVAAQAREIARLYGSDLPAPPGNAQDVDRPVRSGVAAPSWLDQFRPARQSPPDQDSP